MAETYRVRQDLSQNQHIEGLPLGTVGGLLVRHTFPLDGEYDFQVKLQRTNFGNLRGLEYPHAGRDTVDGERVHVASDRRQRRPGGDVRASAERRRRDRSAAGVARAGEGRPHGRSASPSSATCRSATRGALQPFLRSSADTLDWTGRPHIQSLTITGPFNATGSGRHAEPPADLHVPSGAAASDETACARADLSTLARRAYRQPVAEADLAAARASTRPAAGKRIRGGIQRALQRILASPQFVFRVERDPANVAPGARLPRSATSSWRRACRSSSGAASPTTSCSPSASQGRLHTPAVLEQQVRRMLADPRRRRWSTNFAGQWLHLRNVRSVQPNSDEFPDFDDNLRQAFAARDGAASSRASCARIGTSLDLLHADYTFVNERLARHYGIPERLRQPLPRVTVTDEARKGLLGQGSILALTSHAERTSPVLRGKWVLENILGTPPPPPPPDVPALKENEDGQKPRTMREQMARAPRQSVCASCHKVMDPIGFALENFDAVGAWRTREAGGPIDASGELADGTKVDGVVALRRRCSAGPRCSSAP